MLTDKFKRRALLVLVACVLSFGIATLYPIYRNYRVLIRIEALGGDFYSQHKWYVEKLPREWRTKMQELGREHYRGKDQYYKWAARFKNYTLLALADTDATDEDLHELLRGQGHILILNLARTKISGEGLIHLKHCRHSLESLIVSETEVDSDRWCILEN